MLDPVFHEAFVHAPGGHCVLGRKLHPFCALDVVALEAVDSPFLKPGSSAEAPDLLLAVWILSHDHPKSCSIENLELGDAGREWIESVKDTIDMPTDCARLEAYLKDYFAIPEMMRELEDDPLTPLGCPAILSNVIQVSKNLHVPLYEAWTMDIGKLMWYGCALEEMSDPGSRIIGDEMRSRMEVGKTAVKTFKVEEGESLADFAKRVGTSEEDAALLLQQAGVNPSGGN